MAAPVTYNGVASASGGNIFGGTRFWVAQRVPMRPSILSNITSNGGIIEPLEKNAEILIADHARKDAPAGSCSWKFITESIDNGCMQLQDRYLKGPTAPTTAGRSKFGRTAFTHADDVALAKWVLSHERRVSGNAIYQQFETINPRHPVDQQFCEQQRNGSVGTSAKNAFSELCLFDPEKGP
ncbi:hypothetical protein CDD83_8896 [Cordyceps sp. RAO-2017]|nr:hypothetical protein CDD83_8896 [Cordyceps sp. RAO-2017]